MSQAAKIILVGIPHSEIVKELQRIKSWDNGANYQIIVDINGKEHYDTLDNVESALNNDLSLYIQDKITKDKITKSGGKGELLIVDNPDFQNEVGEYKKYRNPMRHLTPKKKKRK